MYENLKKNFSCHKKEIKESINNIKAQRFDVDENFISIILPTKNRIDGLTAVLDSIPDALRYLKYEIIICLDKENSDVLKLLDNYKNISKIIYDSEIFSDTNKFSWSKLMNYAFNAASGRWITYASDDIVYHKNAFYNAILQTINSPDIGAISFLHKNTVETYDGFFEEYGYDTLYGDKVFINFGLINKSVFLKTQGFDNVFKFYCADSDICMQIIDIGYKIIPSEHSLVDHINILDKVKVGNSDEVFWKDMDTFFNKWNNSALFKNQNPVKKVRWFFNKKNENLLLSSVFPVDRKNSIYNLKQFGYKFKNRNKNSVRFKNCLFFLANFIKDLFAPRIIQSNTLVIVRLDLIGDYILFRNYLKIIRNSAIYKKHKITLCANVIIRDMAEYLDKNIINDFIWIDVNKLRNDKIYFQNTIRILYKKGFETAINPAYSRDYWSDMLINATQAPIKIGFEGDCNNIDFEHKVISDSFYDKLIESTSDIIFEFLRNQIFFKNLLGDFECTFEIEKSRLHSELLPPKKYAVISPGATHSYRNWSAVKFAEIANYLSKKKELDVVICGSIKDLQIAKTIEHNFLYSNINNLCGKTNLIDLICIIANAEIIITNETGTTHIAAATKTKGVCVSNCNHFLRFHPYPSELNKCIEYIYPPGIKEIINNRKLLSEIFVNKSDLNINEIQTDSVIETINCILM